MKTLFVSPVSATFELENNEIYYAKKQYDVFVNDKLVLKGVNTNVFTLFALEPSTTYKVVASGQETTITTDSVNNVVSTKGITNNGSKDVTKDIQALIDSLNDNDMLVVEEGKYLITSLQLKSNTYVYLKKKATLMASLNESDFEEIEGEIPDGKGGVTQLGTWEGTPAKMKVSIVNAWNQENIKLFGEGVIDGRAQSTSWWIDHKLKPYARPHILFFVHSTNIKVQGIKVTNSPQWTIHPYFCKDVGFYDVYIENPKISPNTDGLNPQCCDGVEIIGVHFSVGDDCIAIKSGKMYIGQKYRTPCRNITIRNCYMHDGHGAVVLGSEMSGGIKELTVERCLFEHTDRGLRIKTRRGRGDTAIIDGVTFSHILMKNVLTPLVINMFYFCDPDGKTEYVWSKEKLPVDDRTPYLGKFTFKNIEAVDCEYAAGYFYGLPEMPVGEINIEDSSFSFKDDAGSGTPAMMSFAEVCSRNGFVFKNVKNVRIHNVKMNNHVGEFYQVAGNESLIND